LEEQQQRKEHDYVGGLTHHEPPRILLSILEKGFAESRLIREYHEKKGVESSIENAALASVMASSSFWKS
jgi:hypothetical protein